MKNNITKFDTTFCTPLIKLLYEDWSNKSILKIYNVISVCSGAYNLDKIATMSHTAKGTVSKSLNILLQNKYIKREGNKYFVHQGIEIADADEKSFHLETKSFQSETKSFHLETFDSIYNINNNNINNNINNKYTSNPDSNESAHNTSTKNSLDKLDFEDKVSKKQNAGNQKVGQLGSEMVREEFRRLQEKGYVERKDGKYLLRNAFKKPNTGNQKVDQLEDNSSHELYDEDMTFIESNPELEDMPYGGEKCDLTKKEEKPIDGIGSAQKLTMSMEFGIILDVFNRLKHSDLSEVRKARQKASRVKYVVDDFPNIRLSPFCVLGIILKYLEAGIQSEEVLFDSFEKFNSWAQSKIDDPRKSERNKYNPRGDHAASLKGWVFNEVLKSLTEVQKYKKVVAKDEKKVQTFREMEESYRDKIYSDFLKD